MITVCEQENSVLHYMVYDRDHSLVIVTARHTVAQDFEHFVKQGHTALSLLHLARKQERRNTVK